MTRTTPASIAALLAVMVVLPIAGPLISVSLNIYRVDIVATLIFGPLIAGLAIVNFSRFDPFVRLVLALLAAFFVVVAVHNLATMQRVQIGDALFWVYPIGYLVCLASLARSETYVTYIRGLLCLLAFLVVAPSLLEIAMGQGLIVGSKRADWADGAVKGLFYNPNNMGTLSLMVAAAAAPFFCAENHGSRSKWLGFFLIIVMSAMVFLSGSRGALLLLMAGLVVWAFVRANLVFKVLAIILGLALTVNQFWLVKQILDLTGNIGILARPSERYLLLIERATQDGSISYRMEVVSVFLDRFQWLWMGYGTRNFSEYFGGALYYPVGETLPHVFLIETYLAFGIIGLSLILAVFATLLITSLVAIRMHRSTALWGLAITLLFLAGSNIPSTITRLPSLWIPVFAIFVLMRMVNSRRQSASAKARRDSQPRTMPEMPS